MVCNPLLKNNVPFTFFIIIPNWKIGQGALLCAWRVTLKHATSAGKKLRLATLMLFQPAHLHCCVLNMDIEQENILVWRSLRLVGVGHHEVPYNLCQRKLLRQSRGIGTLDSSSLPRIRSPLHYPLGHDLLRYSTW